MPARCKGNSPNASMFHWRNAQKEVSRKCSCWPLASEPWRYTSAWQPQATKVEINCSFSTPQKMPIIFAGGLCLLGLLLSQSSKFSKQSGFQTGKMFPPKSYSLCVGGWGTQPKKCFMMWVGPNPKTHSIESIHSRSHLDIPSILNLWWDPLFFHVLPQKFNPAYQTTFRFSPTTTWLFGSNDFGVGV